MVFQADPTDQGSAECEVEKAFVRDCEYDEGGRASKEDDDESMEVVAVWVKAVKEWHNK